MVLEELCFVQHAFFCTDNIVHLHSGTVLLLSASNTQLLIRAKRGFRLHTKTLKQINEEDGLCLKFFTIVKLFHHTGNHLHSLPPHDSFYCGVQTLFECGLKKKKSLNSFGVA